MKKFKFIIIILIAASILLCSCSTDFLSTTSTYKRFSRFVESHESGISKQAIFSSFGTPHSFTDENGERQDFHYARTEEGEAELLKAYESTWVYEFYKYDDPRDPHRVFITFDSEGKTTGVEMTAVAGG